MSKVEKRLEKKIKEKLKEVKKKTRLEESIEQLKNGEYDIERNVNPRLMIRIHKIGLHR
jgi:hypothetical protein